MLLHLPADDRAGLSSTCGCVPAMCIGSGTCGTGCILELGTERHRWLQPGDVVEMEIERLGMLRNTLIAPAEGGVAMPMPTPPEPGEEPTNESELYRYHLRRLITWYIEALDPIPEETFAWQPPTQRRNSLAAICSHAISSSEWWVLQLRRRRADRARPRRRVRRAAVLGRATPALRELSGGCRDAARRNGLRATRRHQPTSRRRPHESPLPDAHRRAPGAAPRPRRDDDRLVEGDAGIANSGSVCLGLPCRRLKPCG